MRIGLAIAVAGYWLALFVATHIPRIPKPLEMPGGDKWQHFAAYAGLAFLLAAWRSFRKPLTWRLALSVAAIVIGYGILDELTQIPVGRDAEFNDWLADSVGTGIGIGLLAVCKLIFSRPQ
jgi:VanZ family protein